MATQYILTDGDNKRACVCVFAGTFYSWTMQRNSAQRFDRNGALAAAAALDALIAAAGYVAKPLRVVPAAGGPAVER